MKAVKDYLSPKRFSVVAYVCLIVHFLCGLILTAVTAALRAGESDEFSCFVNATIKLSCQSYVDRTCYSRYGQIYNSSLPLYGFVLLTSGFTVLVSVIYALAVNARIKEVDRSSTDKGDEPRTESERASQGFYVFYFYFFHLVVRFLFAILFTVLQHTIFYPRGFDFEFSCDMPTVQVYIQKGLDSRSYSVLSETLLTCENSAAPKKQVSSVIVSILNVVIAVIILVEVIYLLRRFPPHVRGSEAGWSDNKFISVHLLRKRYVPSKTEVHLLSPSSAPGSDAQEKSAPDKNIADSSTPNVPEQEHSRL